MESKTRKRNHHWNIWFSKFEYSIDLLIQSIDYNWMDSECSISNELFQRLQWNDHLFHCEFQWSNKWKQKEFLSSSSLSNVFKSKQSSLFYLHRNFESYLWRHDDLCFQCLKERKILLVDISSWELPNKNKPENYLEDFTVIFFQWASIFSSTYCFNYCLNRAETGQPEFFIFALSQVKCSKKNIGIDHEYELSEENEFCSSITFN